MTIIVFPLLGSPLNLNHALVLTLSPKLGLITLVFALREELKDTDITVNAVMPSIMDTWRARKMPHAEPDKWVKPSDVAELLCCLYSNECDALSDPILKVSGKL